MAIFHSYVKLPEGTLKLTWCWWKFIFSMGSLLGDSVGFLELFGSVAWPRGFSVDFPRKNPEETILPCGTPVRRPGAATRCRTRWGSGLRRGRNLRLRGNEWNGKIMKPKHEWTIYRYLYCMTQIFSEWNPNTRKIYRYISTWNPEFIVDDPNSVWNHMGLLGKLGIPPLEKLEYSEYPIFKQSHMEIYGDIHQNLSPMRPQMLVYV